MTIVTEGPYSLGDALADPTATVDRLSSEAAGQLRRWVDAAVPGTGGDLHHALSLLRAVDGLSVDYLPPADRTRILEQAAADLELPKHVLIDLIVTRAQIESSQARRRPLVVAIEGVDSAGKTTQVEQLAQALEAEGNAVTTVAFPQYEAFFGTELAALLTGGSGPSADSTDPKSMALWYANDRAAYFKHGKPDCDYLLLNRYSLSSAVYQSARSLSQGGPDLFDWVMRLEHVELELPTADLTIILDITPELSVARSQQRGEVNDDRASTPDLYEQSEDLQRRAHALYRDAPNRAADTVLLNCASDGSVLSADEIATLVLDLVHERLG